MHEGSTTTELAATRSRACEDVTWGLLPEVDPQKLAPWH